MLKSRRKEKDEEIKIVDNKLKIRKPHTV